MLCISDLEETSRSSSLAEAFSSNPASDLVGDLSGGSFSRAYWDIDIDVALDVDREGGWEDLGVLGVGSR